MSEKIIETRNCPITGEIFHITEGDRKIMDLSAPLIAGKLYPFPNPKYFYVERERLRLTYIHGPQLYRRKCDLSGRDIITSLSPESKYKVCHDNVWHSDIWNPLDHGRSFDFSKPFFEQFEALALEIPIPHSTSFNAENSDYAWGANLKDCYLLYIGANCERVHYSSQILDCADSMDCFDVRKTSQCYSCVQSIDLYNCKYVYKSERLSDSDYCFSCRDCKNCLFCYNLSNKEYHIGNKSYTKEEYEAKKHELFSSANRTDLRERFFEKSREFKVEALSMLNCENCIGDAMTDCKDCFFISGMSTESQNCRYGTYANFNQDCMDATNYYSRRCYQIPSGDNIDSSAFSFELRNPCSRIYYSSYLAGCSDCFGCSGLRNKKYCILNKQYTKDEYETLIPKIIEHMTNTGEWWDFFPARLSPFWYNNSMANERLRLSKDEAIARGFPWFDYESPLPKAEKIIPASKLPDDISQIPDDILNWAVECEITKKPFRIIKQELEFYRKHHLPIPKRHPDIRYRELQGFQNPPIFRTAKCAETGEDIVTLYPVDTPYKILSREAWEEEFTK